MPYHKIIIRALAVVLLTSGNPLQAQWVGESWSQMGTKISAYFWVDDKDSADPAMAAVKAEIQRIDQLMSPYIKSSELVRINRHASQEPVPVSQEMYSLIQRANEVSRLSDGIFDITYASIGHHYDYRRKIQPTESTIKQLLPAINYQHIHLNNDKHTISFSHANVKIDLGGIAKGYAVQSAIGILEQRGIRHAVVTAGGDSKMLGDKRGKPWIIGIQDPRQSDKNAVVLPLSNVALSTSGDYERYFMQGDKRIHHIITPGTGKPATINRSVSVMGPDATLTDALSTTLFILDYHKGLKLLEKYPGYDAIIIDNTGTLHFSPGLDQVK